MKRQNPWLRLALVSAMSLTGAAACDTPTGAETPISEQPDTPDPTTNPIDTPTHPSDVVTDSDAFLKVTGANGGEIAAASDGSYTLEVRAGQVDDLRTLAFRASITGADVAEWSRVDDFMKSSGGAVVALESTLAGNDLRVVVGTTAVVSDDGEAGEPVARLRLVPTADEVSVTLTAEGKDLGFVNADGVRLSVNTEGASFARSGS